MVVYRVEDNRSGDCMRRHLTWKRVILQVHSRQIAAQSPCRVTDGYAAYNNLARWMRGTQPAAVV
jgi:hypothetical protein